MSLVCSVFVIIASVQPVAAVALYVEDLVYVVVEVDVLPSRNVR